MVQRFLVSALVLGVGCVLGFATASASSALTSQPADSIAPVLNEEAPPCKRTTFKTALVKAACAKGGQKAASKALKAFVKKAKKATGEKITCKTCHTKMKPDYPLKADAMATYNRLKKAIADAKVELSDEERAALEHYAHP